MQSVVFLFGPTGVGKTALIEGMNPDRYEVISADSMQVYRGMDIGTAKPDPTLLSRLPHYLIDIRDPDEQFHLGSFLTLADAAAREISARGKLPVISGGTAYYFKHFLFGLPEAPPSDPDLRREIEAEHERVGCVILHERLGEVDPVSAERINPNDRYRIIRALEVYRCSGRPLSTFDPPKELRPGLEVKLIGLMRPREELYERINRRVEEMFALGLRDEVESLVARGYKTGDPGMKAIGYGEFLSAWERGEDDEATIMEAIQKNSRRYAKRQLTFFRSLPGVEWRNACAYESILAEIDAFSATRLREGPGHLKG